MDQAKISVVIPLYNRKEYILQSIESVRRQTYQPYEIIVVDDFSTDNGVFLIEEYSRQNNLNIVIVKNKRGKGVSGSRNTGVEYSKGDYVAFLDDDDIWLEKHLERINHCIMDINADLICSDFSFFGIKELCDLNALFFKRLKIKMLKNGFKLAKEKRFLSDERLFEAALTGGFSLRVQGSAVHKRVFCVHDIWFDENLSFLEDHQFYLECAYKRLSMAYLDTIGVMIRKFRNDSHYDKVGSHKYRMNKMKSTFDFRTMTPREQDFFQRAIHEMGFILIKGEMVKDDVIKGSAKPQPRNIIQRLLESLKFLYHFPTNRGLREAIKNVIGDLPSRFLVCFIKGTPLDLTPVETSVTEVRLDSRILQEQANEASYTN